MSTDRVGTVRRSPDGVVAVRSTRSGFGSNWLANVPEGATFWRKDAAVADWEVVYTPPAPPHPVGTVMRRGGKLAPSGTVFWEVAVHSDKGWVVTADGGPWASVQKEQPSDDDDGAWEVVYGPVLGARAS